MTHLTDDLRADYRVNRRLLDRITVTVFRLNQAAYRGQLRLPKRALAKMFDIAWLQLVVGADLPGRVQCGPSLRLPHGGRGVVLHPNARIGSGVTIYHRVTIGTYGSDTTNVPTLHDGVYVGAGAAVIGRVTIGANARIGANAAVTKDVPTGTTAAGNPAKVHPARTAETDR